MWIYLIATLFFGGMLSAVIILASKSGSRAEQVENLKAELRKIAEEQARAQRITDNVGSMSDNDVRNKLHKIANRQQR